MSRRRPGQRTGLRRWHRRRCCPPPAASSGPSAPLPPRERVRGSLRTSESHPKSNTTENGGGGVIGKLLKKSLRWIKKTSIKTAKRHQRQNVWLLLSVAENSSRQSLASKIEQSCDFLRFLANNVNFFLKKRGTAVNTVADKLWFCRLGWGVLV